MVVVVVVVVPSLVHYLTFEKLALGSLNDADVAIRITNLYSNCRVYMKMKKGLSEAISVGRGVRQGDPMSLMLFNAVVDMFMDKIDKSIASPQAPGHRRNVTL